MLPLPEKNYTNTEVLATWLEVASVCMGGGSLLRGDIFEWLRDSGVFSTDDEDVQSLLQQLWSKLIERSVIISSSFPIVVGSNTITWSDDPAVPSELYKFILLLDYSRYDSRVALTNNDPARSFFEYVAVASFANLVSGIGSRFGSPFPASWPPAFPDRVKYLADIFGVRHRPEEIALYASQNANDEDLDGVVKLRLADLSHATIYCLIQCATGNNWRSKASEPSVTKWNKLVDWDSLTLKTLALPFVLRGDNTMRSVYTELEGGVVLDRLRLAAGLRGAEVPQEVYDDIANWNTRVVASLKQSIP